MRKIWSRSVNVVVNNVLSLILAHRMSLFRYTVVQKTPPLLILLQFLQTLTDFYSVWPYAELIYNTAFARFYPHLNYSCLENAQLSQCFSNRYHRYSSSSGWFVWLFVCLFVCYTQRLRTEKRNLQLFSWHFNNTRKCPKDNRSKLWAKLVENPVHWSTKRSEGLLVSPSECD